jgi:methylmalonyl-CoA mutase, N-terminal domain
MPKDPKGKSKKVQNSKKRYTTSWGEPVAAVYSPGEREDSNFNEALPFPGCYPYTRGIQPTMYRGKLWTMRQYAGYGTAEKTNERFRYLIQQGQTGLSVAFDLPTQIGIDSDHALAQGEVGRVGVAVSSIEDLETLFREIPLEKVSTSMTINATASILLGMYLVLAKRRGIPWNQLAGTVQNDILKEYVARGTYIYPVEPSMRLVIDVIEFCQRHCPNWNTISISGYHIREAGANALQELAFTFAHAIAYVEQTIMRGLDIDLFAPRLSFFFNAHNNFLEEIAKFRAARKIWAKIMHDRFNAGDLRSCQLRFHTQTAGCTLTAQQPYNNIVRVTLQALAAALGGTQSLHTNSFDEALSLPSADSALLALRTQQIIAYENGIINTIDPFAGSFYIEKLVLEIEEKVFAYLEKIDAMGGAIEAIKSGYIQQEIHNAAFHYQQNIEENTSCIVGLNCYTDENLQNIPLLLVDPLVESDQVQKLTAYKKRRNNETVSKALEYLKRTAQNPSENLMFLIIKAIEADATVGEIAFALRDIFGEYSD